MSQLICRVPTDRKSIVQVTAQPSFQAVSKHSSKHFAQLFCHSPQKGLPRPLPCSTLPQAGRVKNLCHLLALRITSSTPRRPRSGASESHSAADLGRPNRTDPSVGNRLYMLQRLRQLVSFSWRCVRWGLPAACFCLMWNTLGCPGNLLLKIPSKDGCRLARPALSTVRSTVPIASFHRLSSSGRSMRPTSNKITQSGLPAIHCQPFKIT